MVSVPISCPSASSPCTPLPSLLQPFSSSLSPSFQFSAGRWLWCLINFSWRWVKSKSEVALPRWQRGFSPPISPLTSPGSTSGHRQPPTTHPLQSENPLGALSFALNLLAEAAKLSYYSRNGFSFKPHCQFLSGRSGDLWMLKEPCAFSDPEQKTLRSPGWWQEGGGRQRPHGASLTAHLLREAPRTACMLSPCRPHAVHPPKPQLPTPTVLGESGNKRLSLQMRVVSRSGVSFPFHSREHSAFQLWNPGPCSFLLSVPLICLKWGDAVSPLIKQREAFIFRLVVHLARREAFGGLARGR